MTPRARPRAGLAIAAAALVLVAATASDVVIMTYLPRSLIPSSPATWVTAPSPAPNASPAR
jgi:hypothetical protein